MAFPVGFTALAKLSTVPTEIAGTLTGYSAVINEGSLGTQAANIFANTDNGGGDVRFSSDAAGSVQLPADVVSWDTTLSECEVHVLVDVNDSTPIDIYIWGDKSGETKEPSSGLYGRNNASNDVRRYSMQADLGTLTDRSGNFDATLTGVVSSQPALAGFGTASNGLFSDYYTASGAADPTAGASYFKASFWSSKANNKQAGAIGTGNLTAGSRKFNIFTKVFSPWSMEAILFDDVGGSARVTGTTRIDSTTHHIAVVWDGATLTLLVDGVAEDSTPFSGVINTTGTNPLELCRFSTGTGNTYDGKMQELSLSVESSSATTDYVVTEYNNQKNPGAFWTASAIAAGINVTPNTVNSDSVALNPTVTVNIDTNVSGQVVNTSSISNNPTLQFNTDINVQGVVVNSDSVTNNPAINIGSNITVNGQVVNSDSVSNDPTVNITSSVFVVGQVVNTESISNDPSLQFDLSISGSTSNTDSVSLDPSISFGLVVSGQTVNTESVSNNPTLQFNIDISGQTVNTLSNSINPAIQIGEITYSIDTATNIDALSLSININAPILSTNING